MCRHCRYASRAALLGSIGGTWCAENQKHPEGQNQATCALQCIGKWAEHETKQLGNYHDYWCCCSNLRGVPVCLLAWPNMTVTGQRYVNYAVAGLHELCQPECKA